MRFYTCTGAGGSRPEDIDKATHRRAAGVGRAGAIPEQGPAWYVVFTAVVGVIQFGAALMMAAGYRRRGVWG